MVAVESEDNDELKENETDLISEILSNSQEINEVEKGKEKGKKSKKVKSKQPSLIENEVENKVEEENNSTDYPIKKQKVRKKVRVKFY